MARIVRIRTWVLVAAVAAVVCCELAVVFTLHDQGQIALSATETNQCQLGAGAIGALGAMTATQAVAVIAALFLSLELLSADGLTIPRVRADLKAEGLYLGVFLALQLIFSLILGLLLFSLTNKYMLLLSSICAMLLSAVPALAFIAMKGKAYGSYADESRQKGKSRVTEGAAAAPSHAHGVLNAVRKSILAMVQPIDSDADRLRLQTLHDELEADFNRVHRDLHVQTAAATKTRQRLNHVRQQLVVVEEEMELLAREAARRAYMMAAQSGLSSTATL